MKQLGIGIMLIVAVPIYAEDVVTVTESGNGALVATIHSKIELSVEDAQQMLLTSISEACKGLNPRFGQYNFESSKDLTTESPIGAQFEFNQQFTCTVEPDEGPKQGMPTVLTEAEKSRLEAVVISQTRRLITSADGESLRVLHEQFSEQLGDMLPFAEWIAQQTQLHQKSGAILSEPVFKVTTYVDPPNSPGPGVYLAVDFQARYENAPFRCGYVVWRFDPELNLSMLRIEDGIISNNEVDSMTPDQLAQVKTQYRCFASS